MLFYRKQHYLFLKIPGCSKAEKPVHIPSTWVIYSLKCNTCNDHILIVNGEKVMHKLKDDITTEKIWSILEMVNDPEVPVLSILDLGIVRNVRWNNDELEIVITPTYSGCPAMDMIAMNI